jgi:predicted transcriptional regulator
LADGNTNAPNDSPLDGDGDELATLLERLGIDDREASVIGYLAEHGDGRSSELEDTCNLRQPEVSQATKALRQRGWVEVDHEKTPGKGRPVNVYELSLPLADIVKEVEAERREEINRQLARLERLKAMVDEPASPPQEAPRAREELDQA